MRHIALDALLTAAGIRSGSWRQPHVQAAPNRYRGSAAEPSGAATVKVSLHAQENHRVPSAGVSKGRLDLAGGAGRGTTRLPRGPIRATLLRSAQLVCFARRTGNQQFASIDSSEALPPFRAGQRALVQSNGRGRDLGAGVHHGIMVPDVAIFCSTPRTLVPYCLSSAPH